VYSYTSLREICGCQDGSIFSWTMAELDDYDFSTGDAGSSAVFNSEAGQIRVGG
jgi:hypothetical protein